MKKEKEQIDLRDKMILQKIKSISGYAKELGDQWNVDFLASIQEFYEKHGYLTRRQNDVLDKIAEKCNEKAVKKKLKFREEFTEEMRSDMVLLAKIYQNLNKKDGTRYWSSMIDEVLSDDNFVPTSSQYKSFVESKYAQGYLKSYKSEPKYPKESFVSFRDGSGFTHKYEHAIVIDYNHEYPTSWGIGNKKYLVLPLGATSPITVAEYHIKRMRK